MKSSLHIDELIQEYTNNLIKTDGMIPHGTYCYAQYTEDNNETEVYIYVPADAEGDIPYVAQKVSEHLGLGDGYSPLRDIDRDDGMIRLEFVVTVCHRIGNRNAQCARITTKERTNTMNKKLNVTPPKPFIKELKKLTSYNCHGECLGEIARWCEDFSVTGSEEKATFRAYKRIIQEINRAHAVIGHLPHGLNHLRYEVGNQLNKLIADTFSEETANALLDGQR